MKESDIRDSLVIREGVRLAIASMKSNGTTGCSFDNLRQLTRPKGLSCSRSKYLTAFYSIAKQEAEILNFNLYE
jgi:hypothetical protein